MAIKTELSQLTVTPNVDKPQKNPGFSYGLYLEEQRLLLTNNNKSSLLWPKGLMSKPWEIYDTKDTFSFTFKPITPDILNGFSTDVLDLFPFSRTTTSLSKTAEQRLATSKILTDRVDIAYGATANSVLGRLGNQVLNHAGEWKVSAPIEKDTLLDPMQSTLAKVKVDSLERIDLGPTASAKIVMQDGRPALVVTDNMAYKDFRRSRKTTTLLTEGFPIILGNFTDAGFGLFPQTILIDNNQDGTEGIRSHMTRAQAIYLPFSRSEVRNVVVLRNGVLEIEHIGEQGQTEIKLKPQAAPVPVAA